MSFYALSGELLKGSPVPDVLLKDNDFIQIGAGINLRVIHTPGHTPGSISLYSDGHVFTGDTLFVGAVGRTDLPGEIPQAVAGIYSGKNLHLARIHYCLARTRLRPIPHSRQAKKIYCRSWSVEVMAY